MQTPAGLFSTNAYGADGFVSSTVDSVVGGSPVRTNSYTWLNAMVRTQTDPRGLTLTYTWDALNRLHEKGYLGDPVSKAKSVRLTDEGRAKAEELFRKLFGKS